MGPCDESLALDGLQPFSLCHGETPMILKPVRGVGSGRSGGLSVSQFVSFQVRWAAMASGKTAFSVFQQPGGRGQTVGTVFCLSLLSLNGQRSPSQSSSVSVWGNGAAKTLARGSPSSPHAIPAPVRPTR